MSQNRPLRRTSLAAEIYAELGAQRIPVKQLASATGISLSTLYRRLDGVRPFYVEELDAIGQALAVPAHELARRAKNRTEVDA